MPTVNTPFRQVICRVMQKYDAASNGTVLVQFNSEGFTPTQIAAYQTIANNYCYAAITLAVRNVNDAIMDDYPVVEGPLRTSSVGNPALSVARTTSFSRVVTLRSGAYWITMDLVATAPTSTVQVFRTFTPRTLTTMQGKT